MKTKDGYRFSLSFLATTPEQEQVGELLEALGSKKSRFIVQVLSHYLQEHAGEPLGPLQIVRSPYFTLPMPAPKRKKPPRKAPAAGSATNPHSESAAEAPIQFAGEGGLASMLAHMESFGN